MPKKEIVISAVRKAAPKKSVAKKETTKEKKIEIVAYVPKCLNSDNIGDHLYVSTEKGNKTEWLKEEWPPRKAKLTIEFLD